MNQQPLKPIPFIRELCKHKSEEEIQEAEQNFREYLLVVKEICERLEREENGDAQFDHESDPAIG